jgi:hypothetical protein
MISSIVMECNSPITSVDIIEVFSVGAFATVKQWIEPDDEEIMTEL